MDNKTVFVRTSKGEDEVHSRSMHLPGDVKRALLMVDGTASYGEISKRAAPSLRAGLEAMLQELEKGGYITDTTKAGSIPRMAVPPRMSVPTRLVTPQKPQPAAEGAGDLDFVSGFDAPSSTAPASEPVEAARLKAQQEAARIQEEAEREKQRAAAHARDEAARRARDEAEAALRQAEAARKKAEQEAAIARELAEHLARHEREAAKLREEAEQRVKVEAKGAEAPRAVRPESFAFDAFQVDESQHLAKPPKTDQPAQQASHTEAAPASKRDTFSFDSFKIEIPEPHVEPPTKEKGSTAQQPVDVSRAAQPPEMQQPVQQQAAPSVMGKPAAGETSQDERQRALQERLAVDKRIEEEALEAKKQAEAQEKAHAEAKQRAAEAARAEIEQAAKQVKYTVETTAPSAKPAPVARARRKTFSWGKLVGFLFKLGVFLLVLLVGVLFAVPYVLPTRDYAPKVEKFLSEKLHQPVHIGHLSGRILPKPRLELGEVYIGDAKQFQAEQTLIDFAITGLIIDAKPINSIELQGVKVRGAALQDVSAWLQKLAADSQYPVARIVISRGALDADVIQFTGIEGALDFNQIGEFTKASLRSDGGKYILDIDAALGGKPQVAISVRDSALPLLPNWPFEELTAKGVLGNNDLSISEFDGRIIGGALHGKASIDWHLGWRVQGNMTAKTISMQRLNNLLEGNVEGSAQFKMTSLDLAGLAGSAVLEGNFASSNGLISGMDIVETARVRSREHLPGGRTRFDELRGRFKYADNTLHFKEVEVTSSALTGVAALDIDKRQISGSINATLASEQATKPVNLQIGGVTDTPSLRFVP